MPTTVAPLAASASTSSLFLAGWMWLTSLGKGEAQTFQDKSI
jgi:hypothetical protein